MRMSGLSKGEMIGQRGVSLRVGMEATVFTLVRAVTGRVEYRGVDWRCGGD